MNKLTPKKEVLQKYPKAFSFKRVISDGWFILNDCADLSNGEKFILGVGHSAREAWVNAANAVYISNGAYGVNE